MKAKKIIFLLLCFILTANTSYASETFMDKAMGSWMGYPLETVIKYWGYPDNQQTIAGKNVYI